jgi:hypothetical protein
MNNFYTIGEAITYAVSTYGVNYKDYCFIIQTPKGMYQVVEVN